MPKPFRRIVTTNDANGRSEVHLDGPATNELATIMTEMWVTEAGPHNHTDRVDHASKSKSFELPAGGLSVPLLSAAASLGLRRND